MKVVSLIRDKTGYIASPDAMFDVQVYFCNRISGLSYGLVVKFMVVVVQVISSSLNPDPFRFANSYKKHIHHLLVDLRFLIWIS